MTHSESEQMKFFVQKEINSIQIAYFLVQHVGILVREKW